MNKDQTFQQFLATQSVPVDLFGFIINILLTLILAYALQKIFISYANTKSNKEYFANNFVLLALTTMLIITIVKSSLALSLGLIGALSIVRFRSPIKEPEELVYLFLTIGIGLGMGANQRIITITAFVVIALFLAFKSYKSKNTISRGLHLTLSSSEKLIDYQKVYRVLDDYCISINLQRFDSFEDSSEISFILELKDPTTIDNCEKELRQSNSSMNISFIDYQGYYAS